VSGEESDHDSSADTTIIQTLVYLCLPS
jgi:hypothetical protein